MDMHSGGGTKEKDYEYIFIEAPEDEAKIIFYNRFGHNPDRVTCTCCGSDYSITESDSIEQSTACERGCDYVDGKYIEKPNREYNKNKELISLDDYLKKDEILVIYDRDIKPSERVGEVPEQGYVWQG